MATVEIPADWGVRCEQDGGNYDTGTTISYYQGYAGNTADVAWRFRVQPSDVPAAAIANVTKVEFKAYINNFGTGYPWDGSSMLVPVDMTVNYDATNGFTNGANRPNVVFDAQSATAVNEKSLGTVITDSTNGSYTNGNTYFEIDDGTDFAAALADAVANRGAYASNYVDIGVILHATQTQVNYQCQFQNYSAANPPYIRITYTEGPQDRLVTGTTNGAATTSGSPRLPIVTAFHFDGTGVNAGDDFTGSNGFQVNNGTGTAGGSLDKVFEVPSTIRSDTGLSIDFRSLGSAIGAGPAYVSVSGLNDELTDGGNGHFYINSNAVGATNNYIFRVNGEGDERLWQISTDDASPMDMALLMDHETNDVDTDVMSAGSWHRVEWVQSGVSSSDTVTVYFYDDPDATTPDTTLTATLGTPDTATDNTIYSIEFGTIAAFSSQWFAETRWQDVLVTSANDQLIGPWSASVDRFVAGTSTGAATNSGSPALTKYVSGTSTGTGAGRGAPSTTPTVTGTTSGQATTSGSPFPARNVSGTTSGAADTSGSPVKGLVFTGVSYDFPDTATPRDNVLTWGERTADLWLPDPAGPHSRGSGPYPVFVWVHGGFFRSGDKSNVNDPSSNGAAQNVLEELLDAGWAVISPNYRLVKEGYNAQPDADIIQHPDQIDDIKLCLSYFKYHDSKRQGTYPIDMDRVAVGGHSAGGYLAAVAGLSASLSNTTVNYYQQFPTAGLTTYDMDVTSRYSISETGYTVEDIKPICIAVWEAPVDLSWARTVDPSYTLDETVRSYLGIEERGGSGANAFQKAGASDATSALIDHASIVEWTNNDPDPDTFESEFITSDAPPIFYVACENSTFDIIGGTGTFLPTYNSGGTGTPSTGGHGFFLKKMYEESGILNRHTEYFGAPGDDHDTINSYRATEAVTWLEQQYALTLDGDGTRGQAATSGSPSVAKSVEGTTTGSAAPTGTPALDISVSGTSAGSSVTSGAPSLTISTSGTTNGSATASGSPTRSLSVAGTTTGSATTSGSPVRGLSVEGTSTGSATTSGSPTRSLSVEGTTTGPATTSGSPILDLSVEGTSTGTAAPSGAPSLAISVEGSSTGSARTSGAPSSAPEVTGTSVGSSAPSGSPSLSTSVAGTTTGASSTSGSPVLDLSAGGSSVGSGSTSGSPVLDLSVEGSSIGSGSTSGTPSSEAPPVTGEAFVAGTTDGAGSAAGSPSLNLFVDGTSTGQATTSGSPTRVHSVEGTTNGSAATSGSPITGLFVSGTSTGGARTSGAPTADLVVLGTSTGASSLSGSPSTTKILSGTTTGSSQASGTPTTGKYVAGTATGTGSASGTAKLTKYVSGTSSGVATASGRLSALAVTYWIVQGGDTLSQVLPINYVYDDDGTLRVGPSDHLSYLFTVGVDGP